MQTDHSTSTDDQKIGKTILSDLHQSGLWKTIRDDFMSLQDFFLTSELLAAYGNLFQVNR